MKIWNDKGCGWDEVARIVARVEHSGEEYGAAKTIREDYGYNVELSFGCIEEFYDFVDSIKYMGESLDQMLHTGKYPAKKTNIECMIFEDEDDLK